MLLQTVVLSCLAALASAQLHCYECNPRSAGRCESPLRNVVPISCSETRQTADRNAMMITEEIIKMRDNSTEDFCYYLYFDAGIPDQTGYHRGCSTKTRDLVPFCDILEARMEKRLANGKMIGCKTCNVSGCNTGNFQTATPLRRSPPAVPLHIPPTELKGAGSRVVQNLLVLCWFYFFKTIMF